MTGPTEHAAPAAGDREPLRIWWNRNLQGKISPGKLAAHAAHAALAAYGIVYEHPIVVLAAGKARIEQMPISIRDAGHTELAPGTVTTGVELPRVSRVPAVHEKTIRETLTQAIVGATQDGYWLLEDATFRLTDEGELVADVYDVDGQVSASFAVQITVGRQVTP